MWDFTELMLRKARAAISWLLRPWVISARISASRGVSPAERPGQSPAPSTLVSLSPGRMTISPRMTRSSAATISGPVSTFER